MLRLSVLPPNCYMQAENNAQLHPTDLVAVTRCYKQNIGVSIRKLDAVRGHRRSSGIWIYKGRGNEVKAGIQVVLAARSNRDRQYLVQNLGRLQCSALHWILLAIVLLQYTTYMLKRSIVFTLAKLRVTCTCRLAVMSGANATCTPEYLASPQSVLLPRGIFQASQSQRAFKQGSLRLAC